MSEPTPQGRRLGCLILLACMGLTLAAVIAFIRGIS